MKAFKNDDISESNPTLMVSPKFKSDGKARNAYARPTLLQKPSGEIFRNEAYLLYVAVTKDEEQHRRRTFYEAVNVGDTEHSCRNP